MSYSEELIETFPIDNNQGTYYFRHMGEFEIVNSIGSGIFSEIFTAKPKNQAAPEDSNKFNYIIKIFKKNDIFDHNSEDKPPKKILFNEICQIHLLNKIKNLQNPNIIQIYDWNIDRNTCEARVLMDYMPYNLKNYFSKEENLENLDENLLKTIAFQILNGLNSLHKNRIIHFNLKPENILFEPKNKNIKISGFSLSQYITYDLDKNILINGGTYSYMPIEGLLKTKKYSFSYDIWSLGCILIELLCRKNPFEGYDSKSVFNYIISVFGVDVNYLSNFDKFCKNCIYLNSAKKRLINYIKKNQKIKLISDEFYDLISKMLFINPNYRIKAEEALNHLWFKNYTN